jgi:hypothetical protein
MHSLSELKKLLLDNNIPVKEYAGWYLKVKKDVWTMLDDQYYCNDKIVKRKEILARYKKK